MKPASLEIRTDMSADIFDASLHIRNLIDNEPNFLEAWVPDFCFPSFSIEICQKWLRINANKYASLKPTFNGARLRFSQQQDLDRLLNDFCDYVEYGIVAYIKKKEPSFKELSREKRTERINPDVSMSDLTLGNMTIILTRNFWRITEDYREIITFIAGKTSAPEVNALKTVCPTVDHPKAINLGTNQSSTLPPRKFYKLRNEGYGLSVTKKIPFGAKNLWVLQNRYVLQSLDFAYQMAFGSGEHRDHRSGGTHIRMAGEIFANAFQGKLSEFAIYQLTAKNHNVVPPDTSIHGLGVWDSYDLLIDDDFVSVKSTKSYGNLLLLETKDWDDEGIYIPNSVSYDRFVLVRIKPDIETVLRDSGLLFSKSIDKNVLNFLFASKIFEFDVPGFITKEDLIFLISNRYIIWKGQRLNSKTTMDATNYYCQCSDMRDFEV